MTNDFILRETEEVKNTTNENITNNQHNFESFSKRMEASVEFQFGDSI